MVWFGSSLLWLILGYSLVKFLAYLKRMAIGILGHKVKIDQKLNMEAYRKFIATRKLEDEDIEIDGREKYRKLSWKEPTLGPTSWRWKGDPQVEMVVDETNGFLVKYFLQYNKNKGLLRGHQVSDVFVDILREEGLIPPIPRIPNPRPADAAVIKFEKTVLEGFEANVDSAP